MVAVQGQSVKVPSARKVALRFRNWIGDSAVWQTCVAAILFKVMH
jgi:hypothetical protein